MQILATRRPLQLSRKDKNQKRCLHEFKNKGKYNHYKSTYHKREVVVALKNHREKPRIKVKLETFMSEINRIKKPFILADQKIPDDAKQEIEVLRGYIQNLEKIKRVYLHPEKENRD